MSSMQPIDDKSVVSTQQQNIVTGTTTSTNPFGAVLNKASALKRRMSSPHGDNIARAEIVVNKQLSNLENNIKDTVKKTVVKFGNEVNDMIDHINKLEDSSSSILKEQVEKDTEIKKKLEEVEKENEDLKKQIEKISPTTSI